MIGVEKDLIATHRSSPEGREYPIMRLDGILVKERFRKELGDIKTLAESIDEMGLLHPIVVNEANELIAGYRRLKALKELGIIAAPVNVVNIRDTILGEFHENQARKDFAPSELIAIKHAIEERKGLLNPDGSRRRGRPINAQFAHLPKGSSNSIVSKLSGYGPKTIDKIQAVVDAGKRDPTHFEGIVQKMDSGNLSPHYAYKLVKRQARHENPPALPKGIFDVILADPPYAYDFGLRGAADEHFATMEVEELLELGKKIPKAKECVLFLWSPGPKLPEALDVLDGWGFKYKNAIVWYKDKPGTGDWLEEIHELLLIGTRGGFPPPPIGARFPSVFTAPRKAHSEKPQHSYFLIEAMCPNRRYLELFHRGAKRDGWAQWGDESARVTSRTPWRHQKA